MPVEVLPGATLHAHILQLEANLEGTLQHTTVADVLQLRDHDRVTLARLAVLEVDTSPNLAIHADACSDFDFL